MTVKKPQQPVNGPTTSHINRPRAEILMQLIDCATEDMWAHTVSQMSQRGYSVKDIRDAWLVLQQEAGLVGMVPDAEDFNVG